MSTPPPDIRDATGILFALDDYEAGRAQFSVADPREVRRLVSLIQLKPWGNAVPMCQHVLTVTFQTAASIVEASNIENCPEL